MEILTDAITSAQTTYRQTRGLTVRVRVQVHIALYSRQRLGAWNACHLLPLYPSISRVWQLQPCVVNPLLFLRRILSQTVCLNIESKKHWMERQIDAREPPCASQEQYMSTDYKYSAGMNTRSSQTVQGALFTLIWPISPNTGPGNKQTTRPDSRRIVFSVSSASQTARDTSPAFRRQLD